MPIPRREVEDAPLRVLVVDDVPEDRALVLRHLGNEFGEMEATEIHEIEGLEPLLPTVGERFDVVVTDYHLQSATGIDVLEAVRRRAPRIPVVMFTGTGNEEVAVEAMRSGLDDYVIKSHEHLKKLPAAVRTALERERLRRASDRAAGRLRTLVTASERLHRPLDAAGTLAALVRVSSEALGVIALAWYDEGSGRPEIAAYAPTGEADAPEGGGAVNVLLESLRSSLPAPPLRSPEGVLRVDPVGGSFFADLAANGAPRAALEGLGATSALVVPIPGRVGAGGMALMLTDDALCFTDGDEELAQELARRASVALENARLYDSAVSSDEAKSRFLGVVSHELRTPLQGIAGFAALLENGLGGDLDEKGRDYLRRIRRGTDHMVELIEEILTFAATDRGDLQPRVATVDAVEMGRDAAALVASQVGAEVELELDVPDRIELRTDGRMLRQILLNLLGNAVRYTEQGAVRLTLAPRAGGGLEIRVRDTGIGIPESELDRVFEPFHQVDQSTTRVPGGTGLGLAVIRRLVDLLAGEVAVESRIGEGSEFRVTLPDLPEPPSAPPSGSGQPPR